MNKIEQKDDLGVKSSPYFRWKTPRDAGTKCNAITGIVSKEAFEETSQADWMGCFSQWLEGCFSRVLTTVLTTDAAFGWSSKYQEFLWILMVQVEIVENKKTRIWDEQLQCLLRTLLSFSIFFKTKQKQNFCFKVAAAQLVFVISRFF